ncbi:hypothetical protein HK102_007430, partial [Quaeritorhiza haematococci]
MDCLSTPPSNNPVVRILFNHPQNAILAGGELNTADSIDISVIAMRGDLEYRIDILDLSIVLSAAIARSMDETQPGQQNGIATIRYSQSISPTVIRNFGEEIDESDNNSEGDYSGDTDEEIEISTDSVYEVTTNRPLKPDDLRYILRQPPTRTVTTAT